MAKTKEFQYSRKEKTIFNINNLEKQLKLNILKAQGVSGFDFSWKQNLYKKTNWST